MRIQGASTLGEAKSGWGWPGKHIASEGADIYVEEHGAGEPLVCLHNFSANSRTRFEKLAPILSKRYRCILMDLRSHGRSTGATKGWSHELVAKDIVSVCQSLGINQSRFLAASSGAMAMLRVARQAPELVHSMVLDSSTFRIPESARKFYKDPETLSPRLKQYYETANEVMGPEHGMKLAGVFHDFRLPECDINQPIENLHGITAPTFLIAGDRDIFFPVDIPISMKQAIPKSELHVHPQTGHIVMEFFPEYVAQLALDFFDRNV